MLRPIRGRYVPGQEEERAMWDLWVILITAITFALAFGLVRWFDQI